MKPRMRMMKTAGPSPLSCLASSRPQASHFSATVRNPANSRPRPQRGHLQPSPAASGETGGYQSSANAAPPLMDRDRRAGAAEDVDAEEQEQPHHVDEVPVPGRRLEAEMLLGLEMTRTRAEQADGQEDRADDDVEAVEAGRHEEGGGIGAALFELERIPGRRIGDEALERERRARIFDHLKRREQEAEHHRASEAAHEIA